MQLTEAPQWSAGTCNTASTGRLSDVGAVQSPRPVIEKATNEKTFAQMAHKQKRCSYEKLHSTFVMHAATAMTDVFNDSKTFWSVDELQSPTRRIQFHVVSSSALPTPPHSSKPPNPYVVIRVEGHSTPLLKTGAVSRKHEPSWHENLFPCTIKRTAEITFAVKHHATWPRTSSDPVLAVSESYSLEHLLAMQAVTIPLRRALQSSRPSSPLLVRRASISSSKSSPRTPTSPDTTSPPTLTINIREIASIETAHAAQRLSQQLLLAASSASPGRVADIRCQKTFTVSFDATTTTITAAGKSGVVSPDTGTTTAPAATNVAKGEQRESTPMPAIAIPTITITPQPGSSSPSSSEASVHSA
ncbi:hypothetical protein FISHEDRAFT_60555 [Fistulina hepatica ATCC 64428]|uniref:C2 domain-containing protein n=1 Tax=Fistulina hepatica ATCC 64428 TaxID=1128425 RepID=A0A0D7A4W7_9AGAR|nr:hypothetical protein FISHEDRAFT_60555 [Fistulina hepatica ATCC 64428]